MGKTAKTIRVKKLKLILLILGGVLVLLIAVLKFASSESEETEPPEFQKTVKLANRPEVGAQYQYPTQFTTFKNTLAAAKRGDKDAQFFLGWVYHMEQNEKEFNSSPIIRELHLLFEKMHVYLDDADERRSVHWLRLAAEQGQANAQGFLANDFLCNAGVKKGHLSQEECQKWLRNAAEKGDWLAQNDLGYQVIRTNIVDGYKWLYLANRKNPDTNRVATLRGTASRMSTAQLQEAQRRIKEFNEAAKPASVKTNVNSRSGIQLN